jgi:hypothetical protein
MRFGTCRLARLIRGWRLDRNPLRRRSDRVETVVLGVLVAAFLAVVPFAAHAAGSWAYATSAREAQAQRAALRQVPATLLQASRPMTAYPAAGYAPLGAAARWRAPDGQVITGIVFPPSGMAAGSTVQAWIDRAGQLAEPPPGPAQLVSRAHLAEEVAVGTLAIVLIAAGRLVRWALNYCRMASWDADWLATRPRWSPRP